MSAFDDELLTVDEVAALLKVNRQTVRNWIDSEKLPALRVGRRVRVKSSAVRTFVGDTPDQPGSPPLSTATLGLDRHAVASALEGIASGLSDLATAIRNAA